MLPGIVLVFLAALPGTAYGQSRQELLAPWFRGDPAGTQKLLIASAQVYPGNITVRRCAAEFETERGDFAAALRFLAQAKQMSGGDLVQVRREAKLRAAIGDFPGAEKAALDGQRWDGRELRKLRQHDPVSLNALGEVYAARGQHQQAIAICERSLKESRKRLPAEWAEAKVLTAFAHLASGDANAARAAAEEAVNFCRQNFGEVGPRTLDAKDALGAALAAQGLYAEADPLLASVITTRQELYERAHPKTAASFLYAARSLAAQGEITKALEFAAEAVRLIRAALPAPNARTALVLAGSAAIDEAAGKPEDAREKLRAASQLLAMHLGEDVPSVRSLSQRLSALPPSRP